MIFNTENDKEANPVTPQPKQEPVNGDIMAKLDKIETGTEIIEKRANPIM